MEELLKEQKKRNAEIDAGHKMALTEKAALKLDLER